MLKALIGKSETLHELLAAAAEAAHLLYVDGYSHSEPSKEAKKAAAQRLHRAIREYDGRG